MQVIFVRKLVIGIGAFFFGAVLVLVICSAVTLAGNSKMFGETEKETRNNRQTKKNSNNHNNPENSNNPEKYIDPQPELQKQLLERSKKYLLSIEKNQSHSPELKARLKLQAEKLIASGLKNLSDFSIVQHESCQPANRQIDTAFLAIALNKINSENSAYNQNEKISLALQTASYNAMRALEFLRGYSLCEYKIYVPTIRDVKLRVAVSDKFEFFRFARTLLRRSTNSTLFGNPFAFGAIGCSELISTPAQPRDLKSFARLLAKNIKSVAATEITITNFSFRISFNKNIAATSVLIAETIVMRN
ncbi:MAG: hypothetical protein LBT09_10550 [Planctomycetaceae bacterium]|jgi:hypothetical protein|nr:hypothetical protein [Planctomycetaceae bacterium]